MQLEVWAALYQIMGHFTKKNLVHFANPQQVRKIRKIVNQVSPTAEIKKSKKFLKSQKSKIRQNSIPKFSRKSTEKSEKVQ